MTTPDTSRPQMPDRTAAQDHGAWLDPRPAIAGNALAARPASVRPRKLVLFDNGKIGPPYHHWAPVAQTLRTMLEAMGEVRLERRDLLVHPMTEHGPRVAQWLRDGIDGVVFALCDAGVTQPTVLQAVAAEKAGIPTAVVCLEQTAELGAAIASFLAPGLPIVTLASYRAASPQTLVSAVRALEGDLRSALGAPVAELQAEAVRRYPFTASLTRAAGEPVTAQQGPGVLRHEPFADYTAAHFMSDGLPAVAPTPARVRHMLAAAGRPTNEVLIDTLIPSGAALTVGQAAICAVMAGCTPERFFLVLAALGAMADPAYRLELATITTHPSPHIILFSGPLAAAAGVVSGRGCLGPGHAANATIGRAVSLCMLNVARAIPGRSSLCLIGSPAQFTCCFADAAEGPYPALASVLASPGESIVWVHKAETPHNMVDHISTTPESLLGTFASVAATLGGNASYLPSDLLFIVNPEHAQVLADAGWSRPQVQRYLWEHARIKRADTQGRGVKPEWPQEWHGWDRIPNSPSPERIWIVVAGAAGPQSMVSMAWGWTRAVWRRIEAPVAAPISDAAAMPR